MLISGCFYMQKRANDEVDDLEQAQLGLFFSAIFLSPHFDVYNLTKTRAEVVHVRGRRPHTHNAIAPPLILLGLGKHMHFLACEGV